MNKPNLTSLIFPQDTGFVSPKISLPNAPNIPVSFPSSPEKQVYQLEIKQQATDTSSVKKAKKKKQETAKKDQQKFFQNKKEEVHVVKSNLVQASITKDSAIVNVPIKADTIKSLEVVTVRLPIKKKDSLTESVFKGHLLHCSKIQPIIKPVESKDWSLAIILGILILFGIINTLYNKRLRLLFNAVTNIRYVNQIIREENALSQRASIFLSILFILSFTLFAFKLHNYYQFNLIPKSGFLGYIMLLGYIVVFYFLKIILHRVLGVIFKIEKEINEYIFNLFLFNQFIGLAFIPIIVCLLFYPMSSPGNIYSLGLCLLAVSFSYRTARGIRVVGGNSGVVKSYLFVYLCTLEILPLLVLVKVLINKM